MLPCAISIPTFSSLPPTYPSTCHSTLNNSQWASNYSFKVTAKRWSSCAGSFPLNCAPFTNFSSSSLQPNVIRHEEEAMLWFIPVKMCAQNILWWSNLENNIITHCNYIQLLKISKYLSVIYFCGREQTRVNRSWKWNILRTFFFLICEINSNPPTWHYYASLTVVLVIMDNKIDKLELRWGKKSLGVKP